MTPYEKFQEDCQQEVSLQAQNKTLTDLTAAWLHQSIASKYSYHFDFMGRPIIQYPQDMVAIQEIIWRVKPDLIIETGVAHGGSLIMSAAMLILLEYAEALESRAILDPTLPSRKVIGIDIDIRPHNREFIEKHPLSNRIELIQGSSIDHEIIKNIKEKAIKSKKVMVFLDSNHTHDHVLAELEAYAPLVSKGSYCVVFDSVIEDIPDHLMMDRPWGKGNSPKSAIFSYLSFLKNDERTAIDGDRLSLSIDQNIDNKLLISVAPQGYLFRNF